MQLAIFYVTYEYLTKYLCYLLFRLIGNKNIVAIGSAFGETSTEWRLQTYDLAAIIQSDDCVVSGVNWNPSTSAKLWNLTITNTDKGNKECIRIVSDEYQVYAFFDVFNDTWTEAKMDRLRSRYVVYSF